MSTQGGAFAVALVVALPSTAAAGTLDQQNPGTPTFSTGVLTGSTVAQTFQAGRTGLLDQVDLSLGKPGAAPTAPLNIDIHAVSGSCPTGPALATATLAAGDVPNGQPTSTFTPVTFANPASVVTGTQYAIALWSTSAAGAPYGWGGRFTNPANPYPNGAGCHAFESPAVTWVPDIGTDTDYYFNTYVQEPVTNPPPPPSPPTGETGQQAAALKKCKKKHSKKAKKKCKKRAKLLPV